MSIFEQQENFVSENLTVNKIADTFEEVICLTMIKQAGAFNKIISQSSSAEKHTEGSLQDSESCYQTTFVMDPFVGKKLIIHMFLLVFLHLVKMGSWGVLKFNMSTF